MKRKLTIILITIITLFLTSNAVNAQCINEQYTIGTLVIDNFGQSFTVPNSGCTTFSNLVLERIDSPHSDLAALTATFKLYAGETTAGTPQYTQTGIAISAGVGDKVFQLTGGTGSLVLIPNTQYTWYIQFSANTAWRYGQSNSYPDGKAYIIGSFQPTIDMDMIINDPAYTVPVEMTYFKAEGSSTSINLSWQTATELDNEGFEVQRGKDGKNWEILDFVYGEGTTVEVTNYEFTDYEPLEGKNYYRLKQIDFDGQFEYSKVVSVESQTSEIGSESFGLRLYPNPATEYLIIDNAQGVVVIYNGLGQPMKRMVINEDMFELNLSDFPKGTYFLQSINEETGESEKLSFSVIN